MTENGIEQTIFRYALAYDKNDMDMLVSCFAEDGVLITPAGAAQHHELRPPLPRRGHRLRVHRRAGRGHAVGVGGLPPQVAGVGPESSTDFTDSHRLLLMGMQGGPTGPPFSLPRAITSP